jgi:hypothetical protein
MNITENQTPLPEGLITVLQNAVVDNYNEYKNKNNKTLTRDEVTLISVIKNNDTDEVYLLTTTRKDALLYALHFVGSDVTLYLYNRIGRKVLSNVEQKEQ